MLTLSEHLVVEHPAVSPVLQIMVWKMSCSIIGRTDAEAETPIVWPLHAKS